MAERPSPLDEREQAAFEARQPRPHVLHEPTDEERRAFREGLPEDLRDEIVARRIAERRDELLRQRLLWRHRWKYAAAGAVLAAVTGAPMGASSRLFLLLLMLVASAAALFIAAHRIDHLTGTVVYGGGTIATSVVGALTGMLRLNPWVGFWCWLLLAVGGAMLSLCAETEHQRRHSVY